MARVKLHRATSGYSFAAERTRGEEVYEKIRTCILKGEFAPATPLSEYRLAARFKLSRTPVREALTRLERDGMVRAVAGRGAFVSEISAQDIMEIYQVREPLESYAARVAAEKLNVAGLRELTEVVEEMHKCAAAGYVNETFATDIRFHKIIIGATQNQRMTEILATLDDQMHRIRWMWSHKPMWLDRAVEEHDAIFRCLKKHDAEGAEKAMRKHLRASCDHAIRFLLPAQVS